jgi:hypothetical protein
MKTIWRGPKRARIRLTTADSGRTIVLMDRVPLEQMKEILASLKGVIPHDALTPLPGTDLYVSVYLQKEQP